jgi:hypothetical protein
MRGLQHVAHSIPLGKLLLILVGVLAAGTCVR